jgi:hypothetical protein
MARRVTSGVTAIVIAVAAFTGLWSITRPDTGPSIIPTPSVTPELPYDGLRVGLRTHVDGWVVLPDGFGVWVAGAGRLFDVNPTTGNVKQIGHGSWDYDFVRLAENGEGTIWLASESTLLLMNSGSGTVIKRFDLGSIGTIDAVFPGSEGTTWVTADGPRRNVLAQINSDNGHILRRYDIGQGLHEITEAGTSLFVTSRNSADPIIKIDLRTGVMLPGPDVWSGWLSIVGVGDRLWIEEGQDVHCVEDTGFAPCGEIQIPRAQQLATDGRLLWVLSGTGSKNTSTYIPDPKQPATVTSIDGMTGQVLGGPLALPDTTPASISAYNGHAWVGFHDTGRLLRIDTCASGSCTTPSS